MTMLDLTVHFARFRAAAPERINLAAHSHHDWPDVTFAAQEQCWLDAARLAGDKWDLVFGELIPRVQAGIARQLRLTDLLRLFRNAHYPGQQWKTPCPPPCTNSNDVL